MAIADEQQESGMNNFGGIHHSGGEARRAHLALVEGGAHTSNTGMTSHVEASAAALGSDPVMRSASATPRAAVTTAYSARGAEATRSKHETGVRSVAKLYDNFQEALVPMVLASGVSGAAAGAVAEAIKGNPALLAQAERAFQRARINVV